MAVTFSVRVYGTLDQQPPYAASETGNLPSVQAQYSSDKVQLASFPTETTNVWAIQPGVLMNGVYCYGVVEVPASGLQLYSQKYVVKETVATLASLRNA